MRAPHSPVVIDGRLLGTADVVRVARNRCPVVLSADAVAQLEACRASVERITAGRQPVYGITTGVGELRNVYIPPEEVIRLQQNIVRSHAAGVGDPLPEDAVRASMVLRAHTLARGYSGVRPDVVRLLVEMLNAGVHPVIPAQGSVGASGDLAPLAHLALAMTGEGQAVYQGEPRPAADALRRAGLKPLRLAVKEGLALINGTQVMTALTLLALVDAELLVRVADVAAAMSLEALEGTDAALDPALHGLRAHPGQQVSAANLRAVVAGSEAIARGRAATVQDAYSLRCAPQVHGAARDTLGYVRRVLEVEVAAVTDNPVCFPDRDAVIAGGNFHGQPVACAADFLAIAVAGLANISERRVERLVNPHLSGLPAFLTVRSGLHSGYMLAQYTAAALVSENKVLAHPASVDSIPTSANQEDHVSMGTLASRKGRQVVTNAQTVVGIELLCAAQALDLRGGRYGRGTEAARRTVRTLVPRLDEDRCVADDVRALETLVRGQALVRAVEAAAGTLA